MEKISDGINIANIVIAVVVPVVSAFIAADIARRDSKQRLILESLVEVNRNSQSLCTAIRKLTGLEAAIQEVGPKVSEEAARDKFNMILEFAECREAVQSDVIKAKMLLGNKGNALAVQMFSLMELRPKPESDLTALSKEAGDRNLRVMKETMELWRGQNADQLA